MAQTRHQGSVPLLTTRPPTGHEQLNEKVEGSNGHWMPQTPEAAYPDPCCRQKTSVGILARGRAVAAAVAPAMPRTKAYPHGDRHRTLLRALTHLSLLYSIHLPRHQYNFGTVCKGQACVQRGGG